MIIMKNFFVIVANVSVVFLRVTVRWLFLFSTASRLLLILVKDVPHCLDGSDEAPHRSCNTREWRQIWRKSILILILKKTNFSWTVAQRFHYAFEYISPNTLAWHIDYSVSFDYFDGLFTFYDLFSLSSLSFTRSNASDQWWTKKLCNDR